MNKQEFLLLIPAIIYGVAIVDLLKTFSHKKTYWELTGWGVILMVVIINLWMELYNKLGSFSDNNRNFFIIVLQAIIYARAANVITPEEKDTDTKKYFLEHVKPFFLIIAATALANLFVQFYVYTDDRFYYRIIGIVLFGIGAYWKNKIYRTVLLALLLQLNSTSYSQINAILET